MKRKLQWQIEAFAYSFVEYIASKIPVAWMFHFGNALGLLLWMVLKKRRQIVLRNWRIAFGDRYNLTTLQTLAKESFCRNIANLASVTSTSKRSLEELKPLLSVANIELLEKKIAQAKEKGKDGVIVLLAHMGNWELLSRLQSVLPEHLKLGAFYRPLNNTILDQRVLRRRQREGTRLFSKRNPFHHATTFLREGGVLGILVDQRVGYQGEMVEFFGKLTRSSPLPALLIKRTQCEVIALSMETTSAGKWQACFHDVAKPYDTTACMQALEQVMRTSPLDVFWFQERWKVYISKKHSFHQWLDSKLLIGKKSHRALIWFIPTEHPFVLPVGYQHPDLVYELALMQDQIVPTHLAHHTIQHRISQEDLENLEQTLQRLDMLQILPFDFILLNKPCKEMEHACKKLNISPLVLSECLYA